MRYLKIFCMITLITILFTSCQNSTSGNEYVNIDDTNNNFSESVNDMMELSGIEKENVAVLMKSLGICVVTQFAADICYDNSCSSMAAAVELAGRIGAIALAMPMLKTVAELAIGLING